MSSAIDGSANDHPATGGSATDSPANNRPEANDSPEATSQPELDRVSSLVAELDAVASAPLAEHADAYQRVHAGLQEVLTGIDER